MELIVFTKVFNTSHFPCAPTLDSCGTSHSHFVTSLVTSKLKSTPIRVLQVPLLVKQVTLK